MSPYNPYESPQSESPQSESPSTPGYWFCVGVGVGAMLVMFGTIILQFSGSLPGIENRPTAIIAAFCLVILLSAIGMGVFKVTK